MEDMENQMIAAVENQMSELSRSGLLHSAPEDSSENENDQNEQHAENEREMNDLQSDFINQ